MIRFRLSLYVGDYSVIFLCLLIGLPIQCYVCTASIKLSRRRYSGQHIQRSRGLCSVRTHLAIVTYLLSLSSSCVWEASEVADENVLFGALAKGEVTVG